MPNKNDLKKEQILRMSGVNPLKCMRCGKCSGTCPSYDEMEYHPHQFVYMVETGELDALMNSKSIYKCLSCFACVDRCPRGVEPAKLIEAVRLTVIREKGKNHMTPDDIPQLVDDDLRKEGFVSAMRDSYKRERRDPRLENMSIRAPLRHKYCRNGRCKGRSRGY